MIYYFDFVEKNWEIINKIFNFIFDRETLCEIETDKATVGYEL
jgi:hypothetical protein